MGGWRACVCVRRLRAAPAFRTPIQARGVEAAVLSRNSSRTGISAREDTRPYNFPSLL
jgi:hypothetical protein